MLNIKKSYLINSPFDETVSRLQEIANSSFYDSKYTLYGHYYLTDSPEFIYVQKGITYTPSSNDTLSTSISTRISAVDNKTKILLKTSTNPVFVVFVVGINVFLLVQLIAYKQPLDWELILGYITTLLIILGIDRLAKSMLIASFEEALKIGSDK
ncbi:MAG: hypothetical protein QM726_10910 [Chitinophagaceae bacterium]